MTLLTDLGIAVCQVRYGKIASFAGVQASSSIRVTARAIGVSELRLVWQATGDLFAAFEDSTTADAGVVGILELPQDQDGFIQRGTSAPATVRGWYYFASVTDRMANGQSMTRTYNFQIPAGTTVIDLEKDVPENGQVTVQPAIAPMPVLGESQIVGQIVDPSSPIGAALSVTSVGGRWEMFEAELEGILAETLPGSAIGAPVNNGTTIGTGVSVLGTALKAGAARLTRADVRTYSEWNGVQGYWVDDALMSGGVTSVATLPPYAVAFDYDGSVFEVEITGQEQGVTRFSVYSDGIFVGRFLGNTGAVDGRLMNVPVTFPDARRRTIEVVKDGGFLRGIRRQSTATIGYPSSGPKGPRVIVAGDSFVEGTGSATGGFVEYLPILTGWADVRSSGSGGTGYIAFPYAGRVPIGDRVQADLIDQDPNMVVLGVGYNDAGLVTADVADAAEAVWTAILAVGIKLVVVGIWHTSGGNPAYAALDSVLAARAATLGVRYISPIREGWLDGRPELISGDSVHPNDAGHRVIAARLAAHLV